jgi:hypothetical protein
VSKSETPEGTLGGNQQKQKNTSMKAMDMQRIFMTLISITYFAHRSLELWNQWTIPIAHCWSQADLSKVL